VTLRGGFHKDVAVRIRYIEDVATYQRTVSGRALGDDQLGRLGRHDDSGGAELTRGSGFARIVLRRVQSLGVLYQIGYI
jgi:hypothetical protein